MLVNNNYNNNNLWLYGLLSSSIYVPRNIHIILGYSLSPSASVLADIPTIICYRLALSMCSSVPRNKYQHHLLLCSLVVHVHREEEV